MNQKKIIFAMIVILHCSIYSMEKLNEITDNTRPDGYIEVGGGYIPQKYENDAQLENVTFCLLTRKYIIDKSMIKEAYDCYSLFPALAQTRKNNSVWRNKGADAPYRFRKVTQADLVMLAEINKSAIFLKNNQK